MLSANNDRGWVIGSNGAGIDDCELSNELTNLIPSCTPDLNRAVVALRLVGTARTPAQRQYLGRQRSASCFGGCDRWLTNTCRKQEDENACSDRPVGPAVASHAPPAPKLGQVHGDARRMQIRPSRAN